MSPNTPTSNNSTPNASSLASSPAPASLNAGEHPVFQRMKEAVDAIRQTIIGRVRSNDLQQKLLAPEIGIILGSGLGSLAARITDTVEIPYEEIPYFHRTSVEGHAGKLVVGLLANVPVVCLQGRFHRYEGYPMEQVVFPTRVLALLGIKTLLLTNASGAINTSFRPGDIMLIEDHLNLTGDNPLMGPNLAQLGPRFPDMTEAYSRKCNEEIRAAAAELGIALQSGVYAGLLGPTYETPAEIRMFRTLGADAVGMSTVPETITATHLGVRVAGLSCITNLGAGLSPRKLTHDEVIENSKLLAEKLTQLVVASVPRLVHKAPSKSV